MTAIYRWDFPQVKESFREQLVQLICEEYNITPADLTGKRSFASLVDARCVYAHLCREYLRDTFMRIGIELGNRSHATVINLIQRMNDMIYLKDNRVVVLRKIEEKLLNKSINETDRTKASHGADAHLRSKQTEQSQPDGHHRQRA